MKSYLKLVPEPRIYAILFRTIVEREITYVLPENASHCDLFAELGIVMWGFSYSANLPAVASTDFGKQCKFSESAIYIPLED